MFRVAVRAAGVPLLSFSYKREHLIQGHPSRCWDKGICKVVKSWGMDPAPEKWEVQQQSLFQRSTGVWTLEKKSSARLSINKDFRDSGWKLWVSVHVEQASWSPWWERLIKSSVFSFMDWVQSWRARIRESFLYFSVWHPWFVLHWVAAAFPLHHRTLSESYVG